MEKTVETGIHRQPDFTLPVHDGGKFAWVGDHGVADASDLAPLYGLGRVWNDACDEGFVISSPRSNRRLLFLLEERVQDGDGDADSWFLRSADNRFTVRIYND